MRLQSQQHQKSLNQQQQQPAVLQQSLLEWLNLSYIYPLCQNICTLYIASENILQNNLFISLTQAI